MFKEKMSVTQHNRKKGSGFKFVVAASHTACESLKSHTRTFLLQHSECIWQVQEGWLPKRGYRVEKLPLRKGGGLSQLTAVGIHHIPDDGPLD